MNKTEDHVPTLDLNGNQTLAGMWYCFVSLPQVDDMEAISTIIANIW